jgi:hypothetical protein
VTLTLGTGPFAKHSPGVFNFRLDMAGHVSFLAEGIETVPGSLA